MATRRVYLTYLEAEIEKPIIYELGRKFEVTTNIRGATIRKDLGLVALELEGDADQIEAGLEWVESQGVKVEPIEKNIIE